MLLNKEIYDIFSIVGRNRNVLNTQSVITSQSILNMMANSGIRKTKKNIESFISEIVIEIENSNSFESVKVTNKNDIYIYFKCIQ